MEKAFIDHTRIRAEYGGLEGKGTGVVATGGAAKPLPQIILRRRSELSAIVVARVDQGPSGMGLTLYVSGGSVILGIQ
jgi:hypothetical protein